MKQAIFFFAAIAVTRMPSFASPADGFGPLHDFDTTQGMTTTWGKPGATVEIRSASLAPAGRGSTLQLVARSSAANTGKNQYFGAMIPLSKPVDLRGARLLLDVRATRPDKISAFYIRAYNARDKRPAWSFVSHGLLRAEWRTVEVQAGPSNNGFLWEPKIVEDRVASAIDRIELVIGTNQPGTEIDLLADNLRTAKALISVERLERPAPRLPKTQLVLAGKAAAVILHPDSAAGREAAARIAAKLKEHTGSSLTCRPGRAEDREPKQNAIILGNVDSNPALLLLYARYMTPADAICPGPGGSLVHTVHDPFGLRANAVICAASDDAGLARAADALCEIIAREPKAPDLALPRLFERAYSAPFLKRISWAAATPSDKQLETGLARGQRALDEGQHTSIAGQLSSVATRYRLTGAAIEARLFCALWDKYLESAKADPRKYGGPWGFDSDFPASEVVAGWDLIEDDPAVTDDDRLRVMKAMGRWLAEAVIPKCASAARGNHVPHNHQTFPALGALMAGLYYTKGIETLEGRQWLAMADAIFKRQAGYFKPLEDCNGYQWLTTGHLMRYAVARPDFSIFTNGNGRKLIDYAIGTMNNLGYQVPYGDTGTWQCWNSEMICLDLFSFATGDPAAAWAAGLKRRAKNTFETHAFYRAVPGERPNSFDGVRVWPLEPQYVASCPSDDRPADDRLFDKISFRESMDPAAAYLLLDGLGNGGHKHLDANAVLQLTRFDRIWLADNDYFKAQVKYHNSVMVFRDGQSAPIPPYAEMVGSGQSERFGFCHARLKQYAGSDWDRAIAWHKKTNAFFVLDRLTARKSGEYQFRLLWHGVGKAALGPHGLRLKQKGPAMWIQVAPGPELRLTDDTALGENWKGYPHADPVVRSLSAIATVRLQAGESYLFATVIHGKADGSESPWKLATMESAHGIVAQTPDGPIAIAFRPRDGAGIAHAPKNDAQLIAAEGQIISLLGATSASMGDKVLHQSGAPKSIDVDLPEAAAALLAARPGSPIPNLKPAGSAPPHPVVWDKDLATIGVAPAETNRPPLHVTRLMTGRLYPGERDVLAATAEGALIALKSDGSLRWKVSAGCRINDIATADIDADGRDEVVVARQDHHVAALSADGRELWKRELKYYRRPPHVNVVMAGDIDGDGRPEVIAGGENWRFYAFKADGTELWNYESVHPSRSGATSDLDGDGKAEVICGTHYYWVSALNSDGTRRWAYNMGPICYDIATGVFDPSRRRGVILGGGDGIAHILSAEGKPLAQFDTGDEVRKVVTADLDGDDIDEALAGSMSHSLYCFGGNGTLRWRQDLGAPVTALVAIRKDKRAIVVAGTDSGGIASLDATGKVIASSALDSPIVDLASFGRQIIASTENGHVICLSTP